VSRYSKVSVLPQIQLGYAACLDCGAGILIDPDLDLEAEATILELRHPDDRRPAVIRIHDRWHEDHDR
jgi:hypothetical protein